jgi:branched-chain amino acid transport system substrate-binding protein
MLPYTGTFAQLGVAIENGVRMAINEKGGKLGGRDIEWFKVDDESEPSKGVENANRLVQRDKVDVLIGTVHSGVQMGIQRVARERRAEPDPQRRRACRHPRPVRAQRVPHLVHQQPADAGAGQAMMDKGLKAVWITWKYAAGDEAFEGFKDSYTKAGGTIVKELGLPFPNVEFQALLTEIASLQARCRGLLLRRRRRRQVHPRLRRGGPEGQDPAVGLGLPHRGRARRRRPRGRRHHDHDALQRLAGHAAQPAVPHSPTPPASRCSRTCTRCRATTPACCSRRALAAVKGDIGNKQALYKALETQTIDSPRGKWTMSKSHNPVQDIYLRRVENKDNKVIGVAAKALADSGAGCKMA